MKLEQLTVDSRAYNDMGMTVLAASTVETRKLERPTESWPSNPAFEPMGITIEEAREAVDLCCT